MHWYNNVFLTYSNAWMHWSMRRFWPFISNVNQIKQDLIKLVFKDVLQTRLKQRYFLARSIASNMNSFSDINTSRLRKKPNSKILTYLIEKKLLFEKQFQISIQDVTDLTTLIAQILILSFTCKQNNSICKKRDTKQGLDSGPQVEVEIFL